MRVIGGKAKGQPLISPKGMDVRPTADRVKEAIFSSIQQYVPEAVVLDLFAGAGIMGIEALSRYARIAYFVDNSKKQIELIKHNLIKTKLSNNAVLVCSEVNAAIDTLCAKGLVFDLVFMDPPYRKGFVNETLEKLASSPVISAKSWLIVEFDRSEVPPCEVGQLYRTSLKNYGSTGIAYYRKTEEF